MISSIKTVLILFCGICSVCFVIAALDNNNVAPNSIRRTRTISFCRENEIPCKSGQCVSKFSFCDGIVDCDDRSDETSERCSTRRCPSKTFRCKYGACISVNSKCDGLRDCADNSDEELPECSEKTIRKSRLCGSKQFVCDNGQCISIYDVCDGTAQCDDKSDETAATCENLTCDSRFFRCDYGACVDKQAVCNGITDCIDNSDETLPICKRTNLGISGFSVNIVPNIIYNSNKSVTINLTVFVDPSYT